MATIISNTIIHCFENCVFINIINGLFNVSLCILLAVVKRYIKYFKKNYTLRSRKLLTAYPLGKITIVDQ